MKSVYLICLGCIASLCCLTGLKASDAAVVFGDMHVSGDLKGDNISFTLELSLESKKAKQRFPLVRGDLVLDKAIVLPAGAYLTLAVGQSGYDLVLPQRGQHQVQVRFAARPSVDKNGVWRESRFAVPNAPKRLLALSADREDLEISFPGALRQERETVDGALQIRAIMGPGQPFAVRWKPQVAELDADLVFGVESNTIVNLSPGSLRLDAVLVFDVSQGALDRCQVHLPKGLAITQVVGPHLRSWRMQESKQDGIQVLEIALNRAVKDRYAVYIEAEHSLPDLPGQIAVPVLEPQGALRSHGFLALGTDSALQLVIDKAAGCTQVDTAAFRPMRLAQTAKRIVPSRTVFAFSYPTTPYQINLKLADIVPTVDVSQRVAVSIGEDDVFIDQYLDLDIRDAAIRELRVQIPAHLTVAQVIGAAVDQLRVVSADAQTDAGQVKILTIPFVKPVIGRQALRLRMERGQSVLNEVCEVMAMPVLGARSQRGYLVVAAGDGIRLDKVTASDSLTRVHAGSVPFKIGGAQYAYRFRDMDWDAAIQAQRRASTVRAESFHLASVGDGVVYGTVAVNYVITGAPVDELRFAIDPRLQSVEFIGTDIVRASKADDGWRVKLRRKIIGDYNLGVAYTFSNEAGQAVPTAAVSCVGIDAETGFAVLASKRNVDLGKSVTESESLVAISPEELPANYRLMVTSPIIGVWKFLNAPRVMDIKLDDFSQDESASLPALIELTGLETKLAIRDYGEIESRTWASYLIKNARMQFLDITLPKGATVWGAVHIHSGGEQKRARVSQSDERTLKVQLDRRRDPNEPLMISFDYGQTHAGGDAKQPIHLAAPSVAAVQSSYVTWTVHGHAEWNMTPVASSMDMESTLQTPPRLGEVLRDIAGAWSKALTSWLPEPGRWLFLAAALTIILVCLIWYRNLMIPGLIIVGLLYVAGAAWHVSQNEAVHEKLGQSYENTLIQASQAMDFHQKRVTSIALTIEPAWRQGTSVQAMVWATILSLACLVVAACVKRLRLLGLVAGTSILIALLAALPDTRPWLLQLTSWGFLLTLIGVLLWRFRGALQRPPKPALAAMACLLLLLQGCGGGGSSNRGAGEADTLQRIDISMAADDDSMTVTMRCRFKTTGAWELPLPVPGGILLSEHEPQRGLKLELRKGVHHLLAERAGEYDVEVKFLSPLAKANKDGSRVYRMPVPKALTNRVQIQVPEGEQQIFCPTAVRLESQTNPETSSADVILGPGEEAFFVWKPRARETSREKPLFFAEVWGAHQLDRGLIAGRHRVRLRIAQGEIKQLRLKVPKDMTVTSVDGQHIGTWRYDPSKADLEVVFDKAMSGSYECDVITQVNAEQLPGDYQLSGLQVAGAASNRGMLALIPSAAVHIDLAAHPGRMSASDFVRNASSVLKAMGAKQPVRYAFRLVDGQIKPVQMALKAVQAEVRSSESASFSISDDRLVFNAKLNIDISKAGVFSVPLELPAGLEIDNLTSSSISHWDEEETDDKRTVTLHFANRLQGSCKVELLLSTPVAELPANLVVPRVRVGGSLKHQGQLVIKAEQGVRLLVDKRDGVSELDPRSLGIRNDHSVAFSLLKPDWQVQLRTEVTEPLVHVDALHMVRVADGLLRHEHHLRWRLQHAGSKYLRMVLPERGLGLAVDGPDIATHRTFNKDGKTILEVELTRKWFDRTYPLSVRYETRYERQPGNFALRSISALDADLQKHHLAVFASERVELQEVAHSDGLQKAEARSLPSSFGQGDLSGAAFCYRSSGSGQEVKLQAIRHAAADLRAASVKRTRIATVMTLGGETMTHIRLSLQVGNQRHLAMRLPEQSLLWSSTVNGRAVVPARRQGEESLLLPLSQGGVEDVEMLVDIVYVSAGVGNVAKGFSLQGPRFDLPLQAITWMLYVPTGLELDQVEGTMLLDKESVQNPDIRRFEAKQYQRIIHGRRNYNSQKAKQFANQGREASDAGKQYEARMKLEWAYNYSFSDPALNEDARVELHSLNRQQALIGLVGRRGHLRRGIGDRDADDLDLGDRFRSADAKRLQSSLNKNDMENLRRIANQMVEMQHLVVAPVPRIQIVMPLRGRAYAFSRPLQVDPDEALDISFSIKQETTASRAWSGWGMLVVLLTGLCLLPGLLLKLQNRMLLTVPDAKPTEDDDVAESAPEHDDLLSGIPGIPSAESLAEDLSVDAKQIEQEDAPDKDDSDGEAKGSDQG